MMFMISDEQKTNRLKLESSLRFPDRSKISFYWIDLVDSTKLEIILINPNEPITIDSAYMVIIFSYTDNEKIRIEIETHKKEMFSFASSYDLSYGDLENTNLISVINTLIGAHNDDWK